MFLFQIQVCAYLNLASILNFMLKLNISLLSTNKIFREIETSLGLSECLVIVS